MPTEDVKVLPLDADPLVLVVDDELTPRSIIARMVRSLGYRARSCQSALAALRFLKAHPGEVSLLLADLGMPRMDGGELAERARDLDSNLIAVLMAVPGDPALGDLLSGYPDLPFVPKPVSFGDLGEKLERLIGIPARQRARRDPWHRLGGGSAAGLRAAIRAERGRLAKLSSAQPTREVG